MLQNFFRRNLIGLSRVPLAILAVLVFFSTHVFSSANTALAYEMYHPLSHIEDKGGLFVFTMRNGKTIVQVADNYEPRILGPEDGFDSSLMNKTAQMNALSADIIDRWNQNRASLAINFPAKEYWTIYKAFERVWHMKLRSDYIDQLYKGRK